MINLLYDYNPNRITEINKEEIKQWHNEIRTITKRSLRIDKIYNLGDWLSDGKFDQYKFLIENLNLSEFSIADILSFMILTRVAHKCKDFTPDVYNTFFINCKNKIQELDSARTEELVKGLEP